MTTFPLKPTSHLWNTSNTFLCLRKNMPPKKTAGHYFCPLEMDDHRPTKNVPTENSKMTPSHPCVEKHVSGSIGLLIPTVLKHKMMTVLMELHGKRIFGEPDAFVCLRPFFTDSTMGFITMKPTTISENMFKEIPLIFDFGEVLGKK